MIYYGGKSCCNCNFTSSVKLTKLISVFSSLSVAKHKNLRFQLVIFSNITFGEEWLKVFYCFFQVRTILDIGCGFGSFGAHLFSSQVLTMCIANYEATGSQVQVTLERGLPAMIGSFVSKQLPYPSLSFDMLHCASCGIEWDQKGILKCGFLILFTC